jgi:hypothetical protein
VCEFDAFAAKGRQRHHALVEDNLPPITATGVYLAVAAGGGLVTLVRADGRETELHVAAHGAHRGPARGGAVCVECREGVESSGRSY